MTNDTKNEHRGPDPLALRAVRPPAGRLPAGPYGRRLGITGAFLVLILLATDCGGDQPVTNPTATAEPAAGSLAPSTPRPGAGTSGEESGSPAELTFGELVDRINTWLGHLTAYREISTSTSGTGRPPNPDIPATPMPGDVSGLRITREVILPDRIRVTAERNGEVADEIVVIADQVYARGNLAHLLDPTAGAAEWIVADLAALAANPELGAAAVSQLSGAAAPRYELPDRLRPQAVRPIGEVAVDGVACAAYGAADTTSTGARIDITIAVAGEGRLCSIETRSSGIVSHYRVAALDDVSISAPAGARPMATPVASPVPGGTPVAAVSPQAATPRATP